MVTVRHSLDGPGAPRVGAALNAVPPRRPDSLVGQALQDHRDSRRTVHLPHPAVGERHVEAAVAERPGRHPAVTRAGRWTGRAGRTGDAGPGP
ncbi:hypothetical protein ACIQI7_21290 [Kitasatospora sp. NPDC092039]|uniref:hypothetical protein n=1 Tax=Kitasatospora sp. NPDC092039 TaxID=3364086 RepID=UPI0037F23D32